MSLCWDSRECLPFLVRLSKQRTYHASVSSTSGVPTATFHAMTSCEHLSGMDQLQQTLKKSMPNLDFSRFGLHTDHNRTQHGFRDDGNAVSRCRPGNRISRLRRRRASPAAGSASVWTSPAAGLDAPFNIIFTGRWRLLLTRMIKNFDDILADTSDETTVHRLAASTYLNNVNRRLVTAHSSNFRNSMWEPLEGECRR